MRTRKQILKEKRSIIDRHLRVYKRFNSPLDLGYTDIHMIATMKWLERFAGFIQCMEWMLDEEKDLPPEYTAIPDV